MRNRIFVRILTRAAVLYLVRGAASTLGAVVISGIAWWVTH